MIRRFSPLAASNSLGTDSRTDDTMATYSSHGPTRSFYTDSSGNKHYDHVIKPDIVAPGNKIAAASAPGNLLVTLMPTLTNSTLNITGTDNDMMYQSGTSMATPMASGAAALLFQMNPKLTPTMVKMLLQYTAQSINGLNMYEQGAGNSMLTARSNSVGPISSRRISTAWLKDQRFFNRDSLSPQPAARFPEAHLHGHRAHSQTMVILKARHW